MAEELKIYINDPDIIEKKLRSVGAKFVRELHITDTYFDMPGMVLKITENKNGALLTQLQAKEGGFQFIKEEKLDDANSTKKELESQYGIKCVLKKKKRFWEFENYNINLNLFKDIGNFLIVEGDKVTTDIFTKVLKIKDPEYLTKSFAQLKEEL